MNRTSLLQWEDLPGLDAHGLSGTQMDFCNVFREAEKLNVINADMEPYHRRTSGCFGLTTLPTFQTEALSVIASAAVVAPRRAKSLKEAVDTENSLIAGDEKDGEPDGCY